MNIMYLMYLLSNFVQRHRTAKIHVSYYTSLSILYYYTYTNKLSREEIKHAFKGRMRNETI